MFCEERVLQTLSVQSLSPGPQPGLQVASSVRAAPVAGGRRGDGPEHRRATAGRLASSGTREQKKKNQQIEAETGEQQVQVQQLTL